MGKRLHILKDLYRSKNFIVDNFYKRRYYKYHRTPLFCTIISTRINWIQYIYDRIDFVKESKMKFALKE